MTDPSPRTVVGSISSTGEHIASTFNHLRGSVERTVLTTTEPDDHSPSIPVTVDGYRPITFIYRHNKDRRLYYRVGNLPGVLSPENLGPLLYLSPPNPSDTAATLTYVQAYPVAGGPAGYLDIICLTRLAWHWFIGTVRVNQATGAVTMATPWQDLITARDIGAAAPGGDQIYATIAPRGDGKFDLTVNGHPTLADDKNIYWSILDPVTGDVAGGRGNFITGVGLPLRRNALEVAYNRPAGYGSRSFGGGGKSAPAIAICEWATTPAVGAATYFLLRPGAEPALRGLVLAANGYAASADRDAYDTTDVAVRVLAKPTTTTPSVAGDLASKWLTTGNQRSWRLFLNPAGTLAVSVSADGTAIVTATSTTSVPAAAIGFGVDYVAATGVTKFYTTVDGVTWVQLGTSVTITATAVYAGTASLQVGRFASGTNTLPGVYQRLVVRGVVGGSPVADIDFTVGWGNGDSVGTSKPDFTGNTWALQAGSVVQTRPWVKAVDLGPTGAILGYTEAIKYVGGMTLMVDRDGVVLLVREAAGVWTVERWIELPDGTWTQAVLHTESSGKKLFRPIPILGGGPFACAVSLVHEYGDDYTDYNADLILV